VLAIPRDCFFARDLLRVGAMALSVKRFPVHTEEPSKPERVVGVELLPNECDAAVSLIHAGGSVVL
jgi:hypothetical protein